MHRMQVPREIETAVIPDLVGRRVGHILSDTCSVGLKRCCRTFDTRYG